MCVHCFTVHSWHNQFADLLTDCFKGCICTPVIHLSCFSSLRALWNWTLQTWGLVPSWKGNVQLAPFSYTICLLDSNLKCSLSCTWSKYYGSDSCVRKSLLLCWLGFVLGVTVLIAWDDIWFVLWHYTVKNKQNLSPAEGWSLNLCLPPLPLSVFSSSCIRWEWAHTVMCQATKPWCLAKQQVQLHPYLLFPFLFFILFTFILISGPRCKQQLSAWFLAAPMAILV